MEAQITVKMTPTEFDLLRRTLDAHYANQKSIARDSSCDPKLRQEARAESILTNDLRKKLR